MDGNVFPALVAIVTAAAILFWPGKTAGVLLLVAPVIWGKGAAEQEAGLHAGLNIASAVAGIATAMYAPLLFSHQTTPATRRLQIASIVYCLALIPSIFLSADVQQSFQGYVRLISPIVFMFALLHLSQPRGEDTFQFKTMALATISFIGILIAAEFAGQGLYDDRGIYRLRAFSLHFQHISLFSVTATAILICGLLLGKHRRLYAAGIVALIACTYLSGYRTAWIGMAIVVGLVLLIARKSRAAKVTALLLGVVLLAESDRVVQSLARYSEPGEPSVSSGTLDQISSGRISTDSVALDRYVLGSPAEWLFGIGVYSSEQVSLERRGDPTIIHSDLLATLIECGVLGLIGYSFLLVTTGWVLLSVRHQLSPEDPARYFLTMALVLFAAFTVMGIASALYTNVFVGWYYYGFIGLALAQVKRQDSEVISPREWARASRIARKPAFQA